MNTRKTLELGDLITFTPRHARNGERITAVVVELHIFDHAMGASTFTAVALDGARRYGFSLLGHNGEVTKGEAANVTRAELAELRRLARVHPTTAGGVWPARLARFEKKHAAELACARCGVPASSAPLPPRSGLYTGQRLCGGDRCKAPA